MFRWVRLIYLSFKRSPFYTLMPSITVAFLVFIVGMTSGITEGINKSISARIGRELPPNAIRVLPPKVKVKTISFSPKTRKGITYYHLRRILKMKGVVKTYLIARTPFPTMTQGHFLGFRYKSDLVVVGVDARLVRKDIKRGYSFRYRKGTGQVPIVASRFIVDAYNNVYAINNDLPQLSEDVLIGQVLPIYFGWSTFRRTVDKPIILNGVLVGFSSAIPPLSIGIPLSAVKDIGKTLYGKKFRWEFAEIVVQVKTHDDLIRVSKAIRRMGLRVATSTKESRFINKVKKMTNTISAGFSLLIGIISLIAVASLFAMAGMEKIPFFILIRKLGASVVKIITIMELEIVFFSVSFSFGGFLASRWAIKNISGVVKSSKIPFMSAEFFKLPEWFNTPNVIIAGIVIGIVSSIPAVLKVRSRVKEG